MFLHLDVWFRAQHIFLAIQQREKLVRQVPPCFIPGSDTVFVCQKGTVDLEREEGEECEENMEVFDDSSSSPSGTLRNYPLTCKVLYSYKVENSTETLIDCYTFIFIFISFLVFPAGISARWVNHWRTGDVGGHWGWRHGGLGQGIHTHTPLRMPS